MPMQLHDAHVSDEDLLLAADGELETRDAAEVERHVTACWACRARRKEIEDAIAMYVRLQRSQLDVRIPPSAGPRALLKARLTEMAPTIPARRLPRRNGLPPLWLQVAAAGMIAALATMIAGHWTASHRVVPTFSIPNASLTPGATILASRSQICSGSNPNNRSVAASLQRKVFEEYGIPRAQSVAYEVDYLITPALGGADDIHNLWPQSYSQTIWNARVKDALENRLHDLVCEGQLDLDTAQRDISTNWIAAYKKYFQTDRPLETANPQ